MGNVRKDLPKYRYNPWLKELSETANLKKKVVSHEDPNKMMILVDNKTGVEERKTAGFYYNKEIDGNSFVKLYAAGVGEILGLSRAGARVFVYLFDEVSSAHNKDNTQIMLKYEFMAENQRYWSKQGKPIGRSTFFSGIRDLLTHNIIAQAEITGVYFINPMFIFNGDRLVVVNEYKRKTQTQLPTGGNGND